MLNRIAFVPRRSFLQACVLPLLMSFANPRFWENSDPSTWTPEQIKELGTQSPWAKTVTAQLKSNGSNMAADSARSRQSTGRVGRNSRQSGQGEADPSIQLPKFQGTVRWISAKPMLEAFKVKLPASLKGRYVIAVFGLPITGGEPDPVTNDPFAALKEETTLQLKKSESAQPEVAYQDPADTSSIYFGFLPSMLNVAGAKVATFSMTSGPFSIKVKFNLEEMKYRGELAV
jgi:hypothetical protein